MPLGLRDYLPNDIKKRDALTQKMTAVVSSFGYERIITPSIENYDQLQSALGDMTEDCILFFDGSGSRLVLRPDHTTAIARIAASRLSDHLPLKLFYHDPVFRKDPLLGETEIFQFGCEHIGTISLDDEVQIINLVLSICDRIGLGDVEVHVAHPELFESFSDHDLQRLKSGDFLDYSSFPLLGQRDVVQDYPYLSSFFKRVESLKWDNVFANFGLYKDRHYYNGIYFDIVSKSFGKVIGSGGRYDTVLDAFQLDSNAVGFSFRLHYLERALHG